MKIELIAPSKTINLADVPPGTVFQIVQPAVEVRTYLKTLGENSVLNLSDFRHTVILNHTRVHGYKELGTLKVEL